MNNSKLVYLIHAAIWTMVFISPLMFMNHGNGISLHEFLFISISPLSLFIVFYINYLWLTPKMFAINRKQYYWTANIIIIICLGIALHHCMCIVHPHLPFDKQDMICSKPRGIMTILLILRNIFNLSVSAAIATTVQLAMRWQYSENACREAETARMNAELKNLRSQINPHFLLNTLNNIYALIAFDSKRAQEAILELSKMLRYVLYDNQQQYVSLEKETLFITNYVNLMKIRLSGNVEVQLSIDIPSPCNMQIAPLIFISLIENAFKHGVSPMQPCFIYIHIKAVNGVIECRIENSNFPKSQTDRSGHGIGLQQVAKRLELSYPGQYKWEKGVNNDKTKYSSIITIYDTKLRNN